MLSIEKNPAEAKVAPYASGSSGTYLKGERNSKFIDLSSVLTYRVY
jgi:hypothetical protein